MCKFTRTLYICGHSRYTLQTSCPHYFISPITSAPSCSLLRHPTRALPNEFIAHTINFPTQTCGLDTCLYKPENDPFITPGTKITPFPNTASTTFNSSPPTTPEIPPFSTPKSLKIKGRSLFDELQPYSIDLNFSDAVEADAHSQRDFIMTPKLGPIVIGRGCVRMSPKVVYHKYARLSTTPGGNLVRNSPPPKAVAPEVFYGPEMVRKRNLGGCGEEFVSEIEALEYIEALEKRKCSAQLTPMDMST